MDEGELEEFRANQIEKGEVWDELKVKHLWIHVVRGLINGGEIAKVGSVPFCCYLIIKAHTDLHTGNAWPSVPTIAELVGASKSTVTRALKKLVAAGLLEVRKSRGRSNEYSVMEKIEIVSQDGKHWGTAERKYASFKYEDFVNEVKRLAKSGNLPGDKGVTINVTVNIQNITQGANGTVTSNVQNVIVNSDSELRELLKKL
jgi:DNA-binding transcriptional regulator YhcF (GntR family)